MKAITEGNKRTYNYYELQNRYTGKDYSKNWHLCRTFEVKTDDEARNQAKASIKEDTEFDKNLRTFISLGGEKEYRLVKVYKVCETI